MKDILSNSMFFGVLVSILAYEVGVLLKKKLKFALLNPLLISIVIIILILVGFHIDYDTYNDGAQLLSYLLTPATVCLAIPLYEQMELLKKNWKAIIGGIVAGVLTGAVCILVLCLIFRLEHDMYVTLLPKSITTAIGMGGIRGVERYRNHHCCSYHYHRCGWKRAGRFCVQVVPCYPSGSKRSRTWYFRPCDWYRESSGNG